MRINACKRPVLLALLLLAALGLLAACSGGGSGGGKAQGKLETLDMPAVEKRFAANKGNVTLVTLWATW